MATVPMVRIRNPRCDSDRCGYSRASNWGRSASGLSILPISSVMARSIESRRRASTFSRVGALAKLKPDQVEAFYAALAKANPDPRGELDYINPYTLLVAVVLSAQATDASVNKATEPLFKIADTPQKMLKLGEAKLKDY